MFTEQESKDWNLLISKISPILNIPENPRSISKPIFPWEQRKIKVREIGLDVLFNLVSRRESGILPYAKSIGWTLPSHGLSGVGCGSIMAKGCGNVGSHPSGKAFVQYFKHSCRKKSCPICFEDWAYSEAERSLVRLSIFVCGKSHVEHTITDCRIKNRRSGDFHRDLVSHLESDLSLVRSRGMRVIHVVLSPSPETKFDKKHYVKLRSRAYEIGKIYGLNGGEVVFHPYRLHCKKCHVAIPDYAERCVKCGNDRFVWEPSPHFHVLGFGWIEPKDYYSKYGWVVKNLGVRKSVYYTMAYLLSHSGVFVDPDSSFDSVSFHSVTWFGDLSYRKMSGINRIDGPRSVCPYCGFELRPCEFAGSVDRPPPSFDEEKPENNEFLDDLARWNFLG